MSSKFWLPTRRPAANGVAPRRVPSQLAPDNCIVQVDSISPQHVVLLGRDLGGVVRIKVEVHRDDVSSWLVKVLRHWLAWSYGAAEIKIVS